MDNSLIRRHCKDDMKGNWFMAVVMSIVLSIIAMIISRVLMTFMPLGVDPFANIDFTDPTQLEAISAVSKSTTIVSGFASNMLLSILTAVFALGFSWSFLDLVDQSILGETPKLKLELLFSAINKNVFKNVLILAISYILTLLAYFLLIVPGIVLSLFLTPLPFLLKDKPDISVRAAFSESFKLMERNVGKLFSLYIPYIIGFIVYIIAVIAIMFVTISGGLDNLMGLLLGLALVTILSVIFGIYLQIKVRVISSQFYRRHLAPRSLEEPNIYYEQ